MSTKTKQPTESQSKNVAQQQHKQNTNKTNTHTICNKTTKQNKSNKTNKTKQVYNTKQTKEQKQQNRHHHYFLFFCFSFSISIQAPWRSASRRLRATPLTSMEHPGENKQKSKCGSVVPHGVLVLFSDMLHFQISFVCVGSYRGRVWGKKQSGNAIDRVRLCAQFISRTCMLWGFVWGPSHRGNVNFFLQIQWKCFLLSLSSPSLPPLSFRDIYETKLESRGKIKASSLPLLTFLS